MHHKLHWLSPPVAGPGLVARLRNLLASVMAGFCRLTAIQFDAPWRTSDPHCC